jgi:hypothetical protein
MPRRPFVRALAAPVLAFGAATAVLAAPVQLTVTIENLAPAGSVSFAPLHLGFHQGVFDAFNNGQAAGAGITSVAEGGSGSQWQPDFAAADPTATRGTIGGALLPGASASQMFTVDPGVNPFFTFASMVIPSNDLFIGNDSPTRFRLFDAAGHLLISAIDQLARDIWDNGSEAADPANAACAHRCRRQQRCAHAAERGGELEFLRAERLQRADDGGRLHLQQHPERQRCDLPHQLCRAEHGARAGQPGAEPGRAGIDGRMGAFRPPPRAAAGRLHARVKPGAVRLVSNRRPALPPGLMPSG